MLTVDFARLGLGPGERVLDFGCGAGRHAFEALRRGARVVALDASDRDAKDVAAMLAALVEEGQAGGPGSGAAVVEGRAGGGWGAAMVGDGARLPFADASFDRLVAAEVLEHVNSDRAVIAELARVLRPGGVLAVTVPRWFPEQVNWALSHEYHGVEGGHVRIYRRSQLSRRLTDAGLVALDAHHAHALHTPWWWLRCLVGVSRDQQPLVRAYHRLLVWDMTHPRSPLRVLERLLDPLLGKSLVLYVAKPC